MRLHFHNRIHESVGVSAILALSVALNLSWIGNLALTRSQVAIDALTISPKLGAVSGLYLLFVLSYVFAFWAALAFLHGRDCTRYRDGSFWVFVASVIAFLLLTLPFLYGSQMLV